MKANDTQGYGKPERAPFKHRDTLHARAVNRVRLAMGLVVVGWLSLLGCLVLVIYRLYVGTI